MDKKHRHTTRFIDRQKAVLHLLLCIGTCLLISNITQAQDHSSFQKKVYRYSDERAYDLEVKLKGYRASKDTMSIIKNLSYLGEIYSHKANYAKSYNYYWEALLLADQLNNRVILSTVFENIGWLYSYFDRKEESLAYFEKTLHLKKELIDLGEMDKSELIPTYYAVTTFHREAEEFDIAKQYLDSCYYLVHEGHSKAHTLNYLDAELGYYFLNKGQYQQALVTLYGVEPFFKKNMPSYLTILYSMLGDIYKNTGKTHRAEQYYLKSLETSELFQSHQNYTPQIYEKLADLYEQVDEHEKAYKAISKSKALNETLFDSRSENNRALLAVSDLYRENERQQEQLKKEQKLAELDHKTRVQYLNNIILSLVVVLIVLIAYLYIRQMRNKFKVEKQLASKKREIEKEKDEELLRIRNKELTSSALRLIHKDESLNEIQEYLKSTPHYKGDPRLRRLFKSATDDQKQMWCEFDRRFVEVNQSFHTNLTANFPDLTPGERKLCSLLKLNFTSKEISQLLGISIESVHTQRYRLRKKMQLDKDTNLVNYLNTLDL